VTKTELRTGRVTGPVRTFFKVSGVATAVLAAAAPLALAPAAQAATVAAPNAGGQGIGDFYAARSGMPLWFENGQPSEAARLLMETIGNADVDGLNPRNYRLDEVARAMQAAWGGKPRAVGKADALLSQALVSYVRDMRHASGTGTIYVDQELQPGPPSPRAILDAAARAPSLSDYVGRIGWMHPTYGELRRALIQHDYLSDSERQRLALNLERARELPAGNQRYVLVNAAAQRLYMYEGGRVVDSMKVVVGKPKNPTPMMAAYIRFAALNPYWNVPPDLAAERIAPNVVKGGVKYLKTLGYEVLSDWTDKATVIDPTTVDWQGVADGTVEIRVRQLPGPHNSMGRMKFMFPNSEGVYLHDTPDKELLSEASRLFSGGCIRLEDAPRLGAWLFGAPLVPEGAGTEHATPLPRPVAVYVTYLTTVPDGTSIAYLDDIYGRDSARIAQLRGSSLAAAGQ